MKVIDRPSSHKGGYAWRVGRSEAGPSQSQHQGNSTSSSERRKKSAIWAFYSVSPNDPSKAVCHTCKELVSRGGKSSRSFNSIASTWKHTLINTRSFLRWKMRVLKKKKSKMEIGR